MADQRFKRDPNHIPVIGGVTDDASEDTRPLKTDPVTGRLKTNTTITGTVSVNGVYGTNDVDPASATLTYLGEEDADGTWVIQKIDTSSGTVFTYATVTNNSAVASYADAWAARGTTLTFGTYSQAF